MRSARFSSGAQVMRADGVSSTGQHRPASAPAEAAPGACRRRGAARPAGRTPHSPAARPGQRAPDADLLIQRQPRTSAAAHQQRQRHRHAAGCAQQQRRQRAQQNAQYQRAARGGSRRSLQKTPATRRRSTANSRAARLMPDILRTIAAPSASTTTAAAPIAQPVPRWLSPTTRRSRSGCRIGARPRDRKPQRAHREAGRASGDQAGGQRRERRAKHACQSYSCALFPQWSMPVAYQNTSAERPARRRALRPRPGVDAAAPARPTCGCAPAFPAPRCARFRSPR